jgi:DNA-binding MarR family transcriptional regulator
VDSQTPTFPNHQTLVEISRKIPQLDIPSLELIFTLVRTANELTNSFNNYLSEFGISQAKIKILMLLYKNPAQGLPPSELAGCSHVTRGTITGLLDGLEKEGYVERLHNETDRRMVLVQLTKEGEKLIEKVFPTHFIRVKKLVDQLSEQERCDFLRILGLLQNSIASVTGETK